MFDVDADRAGAAHGHRDQRARVRQGDVEA
jgi:hypothetical protein